MVITVGIELSFSSDHLAPLSAKWRIGGVGVQFLGTPSMNYAAPARFAQHLSQGGGFVAMYEGKPWFWT
jgi:hypothetical protein